MILRYIVETTFSKTFTVSKSIKNRKQLEKIIKSLKNINIKCGYKKYSNAILYNDNNEEIEHFDI